MAAGNGKAFMAAWHLTANPPGQADLVEYPTETDATLRAMTFRLRNAEGKLAEAGIVVDDTPEPEVTKGSPELAAKV